MPDTPWKALERRIAASLGTYRTPLSGGNSRLTRSDTLHPTLYIECKLRARATIATLFEAVAQQARKEAKHPVIALHVKAHHRDLAIIDWTWFTHLVALEATHNDNTPQ